MKERRIVCIGLDACDPALARAFAATGAMPNLARLLGEASCCTVINPFGLFVGALWVSFATALRTAQHGFHCWDKIEPSSYERQLSPPRVSQFSSFWKRMSDAGCRVAAIDVPHRLALEPLNGLELSEWGCHDRHFGLQASPSAVADEIEMTYGAHPVLGVDARKSGDFAPDDWVHRKGKYRTLAEEKALLSDLCAGVETKQLMTLDLLGRQQWDFFLSVFGESHAIGHQQWHLHDPDHPRFDAEVAAALGGDPLEQVYGLLDAAVGAVAARVPNEAILLVYFSHGMGPHYDATHMVDEILTRLDRLEDGHCASTFADRARKAVWPLVAPLGRIARAVAVPAELRADVRRRIAVQEHATPQARARQRFFCEPNNSVYGGIRFNLAGREPNGRVRPDDVEALSARLEADLLAICDAETGEPVVRAIIPCALHHRRRSDDTMPDLLIEWNRHRQVATVISPKIGTVHAPYQGWRTGDHRPDGLLIARGPGLPPGSDLQPLAVEDFGPTVAAHLGVTLEGVDGRPAEWLARLAPPKRPQPSGPLNS